MWCQKYMHLPFVERGRDGAGVDCWGLVRMVYAQELGIALPDYLDCYDTTQDSARISEAISQHREGAWFTPASPQAFDVIILRMRGVAMHVGIVTQRGEMLHCSQGVGVSIERYDAIKWQHKITGFARHGSFRLCRAVAVQQ